jgi:hypothetical protein
LGEVFPDPNLEPSCSNPYKWLEQRLNRTETTKTFFVLKSSRDVTEIPDDAQIYLPQNDPIGVNTTDNPDFYYTILCSFTGKIHYFDNSTKWWEDVNSKLIALNPNTQERQAGYFYKNTANDFSVYFGDNSSQGFWFFSKDLNFKVNKVYVGGQDIALKNAVVDGNNITYPDVLPGVDLKYLVNSTGVAKHLVIKNTEGLQNNLSEVKFDISSNRKMIQDSTTQTITLEGTGAIIERPIAFDSNDLTGQNQDFSISADNRFFTIKPDQAYLNDPNRSFPIVIDPGIFVAENGGQDAWVRQYVRYPQQLGAQTKRILGVGGQVVDTFNGGWLGYSESFLNFKLRDLGGSGIARARIRLRLFNTHKGDFNASVYNSDTFNENTASSSAWPKLYNKYNTFSVGSFNASCGGNGCRKEALDVWTGDVAQLVRDQQGGGQIWAGIKADTSYSSAIFCSKDGYNTNHPCVDGGDGPYIEITLNRKPNTPRPEYPINKDFIGNCDLSSSPATGNCNQTVIQNFDVSNISDPDGNEMRASIFAVDISTDRDHEKLLEQVELGIFLPNTRANFYPTILNGKYNWRPETRDQHGAISDRSPISSFSLDTNPPVQTTKFVVPQTINRQLDVTVPVFSDNLVTKVRLRSGFKDPNGAFQYLKSNNRVNWQGGFGRTDTGNIAAFPLNTGDIAQEWSMYADGSIRGVGGLCMTFFPANGNIGLWDCDKNNPNQKWTLDLETDEIKLKGTNFCIDLNFNTYNFYLFGGCHGGVNQKFYAETFNTNYTTTDPNLALNYFVQISKSPSFVDLSKANLRSSSDNGQTFLESTSTIDQNYFGKIAQVEFKGRWYQSIVRSSDNRILQRNSSDGISWSSWAEGNTGGAALKAPSLAVLDGKLYQTVVGTDNKVYTRVTTDGIIWSNWQENHGWQTDYPVEMVVFNNQIFQFFVGYQGLIFYRLLYSNFTFSGWISTEIYNVGSGVQVNVAGDKIVLSFKTTSDSRLYTKQGLINPANNQFIWQNNSSSSITVKDVGSQSLVNGKYWQTIADGQAVLQQRTSLDGITWSAFEKQIGEYAGEIQYFNFNNMLNNFTRNYFHMKTRMI